MSLADTLTPLSRRIFTPINQNKPKVLAEPASRH